MSSAALPLSAGRRLRGDVDRVAGAGRAMAQGLRWLPVALVAGTLPLAFAFLTGLDVHRPLAALLLFPAWLALVRQDRERDASLAILSAFAAHSVLAMLLVSLDGARADAVLAGGPGYWQRNEAWIRTGFDPEYLVANWLPAQVAEAGGMLLFALSSLGFVPLLHGLYQIDLMNCYVGHLLGVSESSWVALLGGWHVWSVLRGVAYARIAFEGASLALGWLGGIALSSPARRRRRVIVIAVLLAADWLLKWALLSPVRELLFGNLVDPR